MLTDPLTFFWSWSCCRFTQMTLLFLAAVQSLEPVLHVVTVHSLLLVPSVTNRLSVLLHMRFLLPHDVFQRQIPVIFRFSRSCFGYMRNLKQDFDTQTATPVQTTILQPQIATASRLLDTSGHLEISSIST